MANGVVNDKGQIVEVPVVMLAEATVSMIHSFVLANRKAYFEDHSLDWCVEEIITHGVAEIKRLIKAAEKRAEEKAAGSVIKEYGLTPAQAKAMLAELIAAKAREAEAAKQSDAKAQTGKK